MRMHSRRSLRAACACTAGDHTELHVHAQQEITQSCMRMHSRR